MDLREHECYRNASYAKTVERALPATGLLQHDPGEHTGTVAGTDGIRR